MGVLVTGAMVAALAAATMAPAETES